MVPFHRGGVGGIMVSIAAFQAVDPGSIPGQRICFHFDLLFFNLFELLVFSAKSNRSITETDIKFSKFPDITLFIMVQRPYVHVYLILIALLVQ